ncbi:hypothetical protein MKZ38_009993 [Zalerion maritima]|uniref:Leucine rich repeat domain containing protein n=1 Tax=Zalerion maritima TaxID=339359 RepID=A0AAD5RTZ8_9PEZI|nr:hypothetical protein MKZ38_009993 [Zalerion maritima]
MMAEEAALPSYSEAISADWLPIVAPYVPAKYYAVLCLVSRRWYEEFAPRLWRDPLRTSRELGLDPNDDLDWYTSFFFNHLSYGGKDLNSSSSFTGSTPMTWGTSSTTTITTGKSIPRPPRSDGDGFKATAKGAKANTGVGGAGPTVRETTRNMVLSTDFRQFATDTCDFRSDDNDRSVSKSLSLYPRTFPNLRCILLDGHADVDPTCLAQAQTHHQSTRVCTTTGNTRSADRGITESRHSSMFDNFGRRTCSSGSSGSSSSSDTVIARSRIRGWRDGDALLDLPGGGAVGHASGASDTHLHTDSGQSRAGPALLSLSCHPVHLPTKFFHSTYLHCLVYLDLSHIPGSLRASIQSHSLSPAQLPHLRILKVRDREMDDTTLSLLAGSFMSRLWSLDICDNRLSDAALDSLVGCSFSPVSKRTSVHFGVEGMLQVPQTLTGPELGLGSDTHGPFRFLVESEYSGTFSHPERYLADAPVYSSQDRANEESGPYQIPDGGTQGMGAAASSRADGLHPIKDDSVDHVKLIFEDAAFSPTGDSIASLHLRDSSTGLTHLYLSGNLGLTCRGLERLLLAHPGTLQRLECDMLAFQPRGGETAILPPSVRFLPVPATWPRTARILGVMGAAYAFRPAVCSDLRELRVHHSLVTQTPTLEGISCSQLARLWLAENVIAPRVEMAYPGGSWLPDMNSRTERLTLAYIPRRSSGRVIHTICRLVKMASEQEGSIRECESGKRRGVPVLKGLRYLRLEFEPNPGGDTSTVEEDDLDAGELLNLKEDEFSFFEDENKLPSSFTHKRGRGGSTSSGSLTPTATGESVEGDSISLASPPEPLGTKLKHYPYSQAQPDRYLEYPSTYQGNHFKVLVWIGDGVMGPHPAVNEYMRRVQDRQMRTVVGPVSPLHVKAGAPAGSYIFHSAWDAMVYPPTKLAVPDTADLRRMLDTLAGIKAYRRRTGMMLEDMEMKAARDTGVGKGKVKLGEPHYHWSGKIEVVLSSDVSNREYWRR